ncbi:MAG TPA: class I SAM-dependent methyltransferase [Ignavibacteria bacterium]|nr:class I SAM-dependent methyltransferase [Ignavibacteria bacterium]
MSIEKAKKADKVDFDQYADVYEKTLEDDLKFFGEENSYFAEYKIKLVEELLSSPSKNILEYGCGIGRNVKFFKQYFPNANVEACDISEKSLEIAKKENPDVKFNLISDEFVNQNAGKFDLIFVSCVFHHIEPSLRHGAITNISKLLKSKGKLFIFEHNPYNPVTLKIVKDCVWDADAILLKPQETKELISYAGLKLDKMNYTLFFPAFLKSLRFMENYLRFIPMGGQYFVMASKN